MTEIHEQIYPVLFPRSWEQQFKQEGRYYERCLDAIVFFIQDDEENKRFSSVQSECVRPDQIPREYVWFSALHNLESNIHTKWDPEHMYQIIRTRPMQSGAAALLCPSLHTKLAKDFGPNYIILPYSCSYLVAAPYMPLKDVLSGFRNDLKENPEEYGLSKNLYVVKDGVITVYPKRVTDEYIPVYLEDPMKRRKQNGRQQIHYLM